MTDKPSSRPMSLDARRGFDMFWITGGEGIVHTAAVLSPEILDK